MFMLSKPKKGRREISTLFFDYHMNLVRRFYFWCSSCSVLVGWSQTSVGPKYWMGPG